MLKTFLLFILQSTYCLLDIVRFLQVLTLKETSFNWFWMWNSVFAKKPFGISLKAAEQYLGPIRVSRRKLLKKVVEG